MIKRKCLWWCRSRIVPTIFLLYIIIYIYNFIFYTRKQWFLLWNIYKYTFIFFCVETARLLKYNRFLVKTILNIIIVCIYDDATTCSRHFSLVFLLLSLKTIHVILFDIFLLLIHFFSLIFFLTHDIQNKKKKMPQFIFHLSMTFISIIFEELNGQVATVGQYFIINTNQRFTWLDKIFTTRNFMLNLLIFIHYY